MKTVGIRSIVYHTCLSPYRNLGNRVVGVRAGRRMVERPGTTVSHFRPPIPLTGRRALGVRVGHNALRKVEVWKSLFGSLVLVEVSGERCCADRNASRREQVSCICLGVTKGC